MIVLGIMMVMQARLGNHLAGRGLALIFGLFLLFYLAARHARARLAREDRAAGTNEDRY